MKRYEGRGVFITAAARGLGFATALRLGFEGARVAISDRDAGALAGACEAAKARGLDLVAVESDLYERESAEAAVALAAAQIGRIDVLVNNAGGSLHTPYKFNDESDDDWRRVLDLNIMGTVWTTRAAIGPMAERRYGRIVNLGSKAGRYGSLIAGANYAAAKGAIHALTRQLAMEFGPAGITCNCVCPGVVMTPRVRGLWAERRSDEERARVLEEIPLRRHAEVEDVAAAIAYLGSDDAAFVTGIVIDVNGGQAMSG
jgi:3-oxoacyl-[acyl-carrier protein] reductase/2-hydroxycyclohexanecarboxyl-CoA dehydrogenase